MQELISQSKRIVIKIGSALVTDEAQGSIRHEWLSALCEDVATLKRQGKEICLVSSGAIALGRAAIGIDKATSPNSIALEQKQAAAAIGQIALSGAYASAFQALGITAAQILLTKGDTEDRRRFLNARSTFLQLLSCGAVPVVNENDTVATSEIRYGDNDRLAARVAQMIDTDLVIQLSTTDGLYTADPRVDGAAEHIPVVEILNDAVMAMAGDALPGVSTGGMKAKVEAAQLCTGAGIPMMIAAGIPVHTLRDLIDGTSRATIFMAATKHNSARKRWIQGSVRLDGALCIDEGAVSALHDGKSLLPAGVRTISGNFKRGDVVAIMTLDKNEIARGVVEYDAGEATRIAGKKSAEIETILGYAGRSVMIHRDNLVLRAG